MKKVSIKPLSVNQCWQGKRFKTPKYSVKNTEQTMRQTIINSNQQEIIVSHPQKPNFYCKFQLT